MSPVHASPLSETAPCPCGNALTYAKCCGRWHTGAHHLQAPTAEALMRSRYSAFVLDLHDYLLATWHPATRPAVLEGSESGLKWLGLSVKRHAVQDAEHATVEFVARSRLHGQVHRLHECSRFERIDGRWYYLDGSFPDA
jgi:SEC-C motif-containing protein